ncbi:hypothetical protein CA14_005637 [Aspergillus flavus]|nr:hypothetical protein CA14_005637 [Aspergillus flavus]
MMGIIIMTTAGSPVGLIITVGSTAFEFAYTTPGFATASATSSGASKTTASATGSATLGSSASSSATATADTSDNAAMPLATGAAQWVAGGAAMSRTGHSLNKCLSCKGS